MTDATPETPAPDASKDGPPLRLYLIDASAYIFRAYHALPPLTRKSDGLPVGAVQGYCNMLWKLLQDMKGADGPTHLAAIFDHSEKTFRNALYDQYKAHRPPPPEDLVPQFPLVREATAAFGVHCVELAGYEADDLIATYACKARDGGGRGRHRLLRQGPDAADRRRRRDVRPDEGPQAGRARGVREVRRHAGQDGRPSGPDRRQRRQCPRRPRHRPQDGGPAAGRIRRPGHPAGPRRRDQTAQAPRDPDQFQGPDPAEPRTGPPDLRRPRARADRGLRRPRPRPRDPARPSSTDGVPQPAPAASATARPPPRRLRPSPPGRSRP
jgi:hypothetical protein